jgi:hypothetical protein
MMTCYDFDQIERAAHDAEAGQVIKRHECSHR